MSVVVYKLESGRLLLISEETKVAIIDPEDSASSVGVLTGQEYSAKLRELAQAIDDIDQQL